MQIQLFNTVDLDRRHVVDLIYMFAVIVCLNIEYTMQIQCINTFDLDRRHVVDMIPVCCHCVFKHRSHDGNTVD